MKKIYILLLTICTIGTVTAQPIFTQANFPQIGNVFTSYDVDPTGLSEGNSGANQTWNFASAVATGTSVTQNVVNPSSTIYGSLYPSSNLAVFTPASNGDEEYVYFNVTSTFADLIGIVTHDPTVDINLHYSDPQRFITFPFTYGNVIQDSYTAFATYIISGTQFNDYRRGSMYGTADAYGSITTPDNSYSSALRTVQHESVFDSVTIQGFPGGSVYSSHQTIYGWAPENSFNSVFVITYDTTDDGSGSGPIPSISASYSSSTVGIDENQTKESLRVFPNPANKTARVNIDSDQLDNGSTTFFAFDATGRIAKRVDFVLYPATHKSISIDMSDCKSGIYFIRVVQKEKVFSSKFLLE
jgi:hypothetical protein